MAKPDPIYQYSPSTALAIVVAIIYLIPTLLLGWQTFFKYRSWFFLCVWIGSAIEVAGYIVRAVSTKDVTDIPSYATSATLIVIAPVFIAAGNYLLIGRLIRAVLPSSPPNSKSAHTIFLIPAHLITRTFVLFDILSFLIQCSGSGIAGGSSWQGKQAEVGTNVLIGGLGLQVATFVWFLSITGRFWSVTRGVKGKVREDAPEGWRAVLKAIWVSSGLILTRSLYRLIEFALGIDGYPFTHEWIFYVFEALPMVPAIAVFCWVHPAKYLGRDRAKTAKAKGEKGEGSHGDAEMTGRKGRGVV